MSLVVVFAVHELPEGSLATGHAVGLAGVFADGGWRSIPASACVGLVLAASLHGARWVLDDVARRGADALAPRRRVSALTVREVRTALPASEPKLGGWSDRGPPA
jgi:hypothetical protein